MKQSKQNTDLFHLIYVSRATDIFSVKGIELIQHVSQVNNKQLGVTGILIYGCGRFMQFLEGTKENVNKIFFAIKNDSRHHHIDILRQEIIAARQFEDWHMMVTHANEIQMNNGVIYKKLFELKNTSKEAIQFTIESRALLIAFKHSCSGI